MGIVMNRMPGCMERTYTMIKCGLLFLLYFERVCIFGVKDFPSDTSFIERCMLCVAVSSHVISGCMGTGFRLRASGLFGYLKKLLGAFSLLLGESHEPGGTWLRTLYSMNDTKVRWAEVLS